MSRELMSQSTVSLKVENQRLRQQIRSLQQKERHLSVINNFASAILQQNTIHEISWSIAHNAIANLGFEDCVVYLLDVENQQLVQSAAYGPKNPKGFEIHNRISIPLGKGIVGTVAKTGVPELINDTSKDPRYILDDEARLSELAVPIIASKEVIGVIDSEHSQARFFGEEHLYLLETIAALSANRIAHAQAHEKLALYQNQLEKIVQKRTHDLEEAIAHLQRSNRDLEAFAHAASHDLKEPIRTIASFLHLIERRSTAPIDQEIGEYFRFAIDGAQRMEQLLDGLLAYAKLNDNTLEKTQVDLNETLQDALRDLSFIIEQTGAKVDYPKLPSIQGYPTLLLQLWQNLLANSLKFRRPEVVPEIRISCHKSSDSYYHFSIEDNGIGIDPQFSQSIFNLYTRLNKREDYTGSGLGLSLCKKIVEKHNGFITADSAGTGPGTQINFSIAL